MKTYYTDGDNLTRKLVALHPQKADIYYHDHHQERFKSALAKNFVAPAANDFTKLLGVIVCCLNETYLDSYGEGSYPGKFWEQMNAARDELSLKYHTEKAKLVAALLRQFAQKENTGAENKKLLEDFIATQQAALAPTTQTYLQVAPGDRDALEGLIKERMEVVWAKNKPMPGVLANKIKAASLGKYTTTKGAGKPCPGTPHLTLDFEQQIGREDLEGLWVFNEFQDKLRADLAELQVRVRFLPAVDCKFNESPVTPYPVLKPVKCQLAAGVTAYDIDERSDCYDEQGKIILLEDGAKALRQTGASRGGLVSDEILYINNVKNIEILNTRTLAHAK